MEQSQTIIELASALAKFQAEVKGVKKDGVNPFFHSKYATLENVIATVKEPLRKNGLSFSQFPTGDNELCTILMHTSGEFLKATAKMSPKDNSPQAQGSAITYLRRYAISAILGLATEEDDDGNAATRENASATSYGAKRPYPKKISTDERKKDEIKALLTELGHDPKTLKEAQALVLKLTDETFEEPNYDEIIAKLSVRMGEQAPII